MKYWHAVVLVLCCLLVLNGCGEQENKNVVKAKGLIANGDQAAAMQEIDAALSSEPDHAEARSVRVVLQAASGSLKWQDAVQQIDQHIQPVIDEINELEAKEDPDDDDYKRLDVLVIQRNYALGLLATQLRDTIGKNSALAQDLSPDVTTRLMLQASRAYAPELRQAAMQVTREIGEMSVLVELASSATQHASIREQAIMLLSDAGIETLPTLEAIADDPQLPFSVAYALSIASEKIGGKASIPLLQKLLRVEVVQTRLYAVEALSRMRSTESIPNLIERLGDNSTYVQTQAKNTLTALGDASIQPLVQLLSNGAVNVELPASAQISEDTIEARRNIVQTHAMSVLASLKAEESLPSIIDNLSNTDLNAGAKTALTSMGAAAVPTLTQLLKNGSDEQRVQASEILAGIGDLQAVVPLMEALADSHKDVRASAALGLGNMKARGPNGTAVDALTKALTDDERTKTNAIDALKNIGTNSDLIGERLVEFAGNQNERQGVRLAAITAMGTLKPEGAAPVLTRILLADDENDTLRKAAATALGDVNHPDALPVLLWIASTLKEEIKDFQREMKRQHDTVDQFNTAMVELFKGEIASIKDFYEPYNNWNELKPIPSLVRSEVMTSLGKIKGEEATAVLIKALDDDQRAAVRAAAAWSLGEIKGDSVIEPLSRALKKDKQGVVRSGAAEALGKIKGEQVIGVLVDTLMHDEFENARLKTAIGLREVKFDKAARGLVGALKGEGDAYEEKEVGTVLNEIMEALRLDGAVAVPALLTATDSKDVAIRKRSIDTLGAIADVRAYDAIFKAIDDEEVIVRERAAARIGGLKQRKAVPKLIEVLNNSDEWAAVRASAAASLGTLRDARAADTLLEALSSSEVLIRTAAAGALGSLREARAAETLHAIVVDTTEDATLRQKAIAALAGIGYKEAGDDLVMLLRTEQGLVYDEVIKALGTLEIQAAIAPLNAILTDPTEIELSRRHAAAALAKLKDASSVEAIATVLVDPTEYRISVIDNIKRNLFFESVVGAARSFQLPKSVIPGMVARLDDSWEHHTVRWGASIALSRTLVDEGLAHAERAMQDDAHVDVRNISARSLGETGLSKYAQVLIAIAVDAEKAHGHRRGALQGLGYLGDTTAIPTLSQLLNDTAEHEERRRDAAVALGRIGTTEAASVLDRAIANGDWSKALKLDIITGLRLAANQSSVTPLKSLLDSEDSDIHFTAADALYTITGDAQGYHRL